MLGCSHGFELYGVIIICDNVGVGFIPITVKNIIAPPCKIQESNNVFDEAKRGKTDIEFENYVKSQLFT